MGGSRPVNSPAADTRSAWATRVGDALQAFSGRYVLDGRDALEKIDDFVATLPPPPDEPASFMLNGLVSKLRERCAVVDRWPVARRAAIRVRAHYAEPLDVRSLARTLGCATTSLQRAFRTDLRMTLRAFQARVRVFEAANVIASRGNVSVAAVRAGYSRDKDLSRVFRRVAHITPGAVRRLGPTELQALLTAVRPPTL